MTEDQKVQQDIAMTLEQALQATPKGSDENGALIDMVDFLGTKENERYHAIYAGLLNYYINASRLLRGNTKLGTNDSIAINTMMRWTMAMKPVENDLASYAGQQYTTTGGRRPEVVAQRKPQ